MESEPTGAGERIKIDLAVATHIHPLRLMDLWFAKFKQISKRRVIGEIVDAAKMCPLL
jgi:hypothetical protein